MTKHIGKKIVVFEDDLEKENVKENGLQLLEDYGTFSYEIFGEITQETYLDFRKYIYELNNRYDSVSSEHLPNIVLHIDSHGGDVFAMFGIINLMKISILNIITFVSTYAYSAAALIFVSGDHRIIAPDAFIMFHDMSVELYGKAGSEVFPYVGQCNKLSSKFMKIIETKTELPVQIREKLIAGSDIYLDSDEIISFKVADQIGIYCGKEDMLYSETEEKIEESKEK